MQIARRWLLQIRERSHGKDGFPMTIPPHRRDAFLVRIWRESSPFQSGTAKGWRAYVQHVQSGESRYVNDLASLIAFFEKWTGALREDDSRPPHSI